MTAGRGARTEGGLESRDWPRQHESGTVTVGQGVVAGDCLVYLNVKGYRHKGWVSRIFLPFSLFFASSCLVSLVGFSLKLKSIAEFVHNYFWPKVTAERDRLLAAKRHASWKVVGNLLVGIGTQRRNARRCIMQTLLGRSERSACDAVVMHALHELFGFR